MLFTIFRVMFRIAYAAVLAGYFVLVPLWASFAYFAISLNVVIITKIVVTNRVGNMGDPNLPFNELIKLAIFWPLMLMEHILYD